MGRNHVKSSTLSTLMYILNVDSNRAIEVFCTVILKLAKASWGMEGSLQSQLEKIRDAGYEVFETPMPTDMRPYELKKCLTEAGLDLIVDVFTQGADHLTSLQIQVEWGAECGALSINSQSGRDYWKWAEQVDFFERSLEIERSVGIEVNHETHRGRCLCNPWNTAAMLREVPDLHITADFSHFVCVCESLLEDDVLKEDLSSCVGRARHIHGRVGHEEGPQVNDPRCSEWSAHVEAHESWWKAIVKTRARASAPYITFNPEFGPPNYMPTLPGSGQPVADLWDVSLYMARRFREFFASIQLGAES